MGCNWIRQKGNGRFLALAVATPYLVCLTVGPSSLRILFAKDRQSANRAASYGLHFYWATLTIHLANNVRSLVFCLSTCL